MKKEEVERPKTFPIRGLLAESELQSEGGSARCCTGPSNDPRTEGKEVGWRFLYAIFALVAR